MMFRNTLQLFPFSFLVIIGLSQAATTQSIPWNQLGAQAAKQCGGKGFAVTELWNGYRLECRMQDLQAEVTMSSAKIISTSKSEGGGSFTIRASRLGRETSMQNLPAVADWMTLKDGAIQAGRKDLVEEYTTSGDGIRQDFVINSRPEGQGKLLLDIAIDGAGVTTKSMGEGIEMRLSSGRALSYHALNVTDAAGKTLVSSFVKATNNIITIAVDDKNGSYPIRIDPTITDANWVSLDSGVNDNVRALVFDDSGNLYLGGQFTIAGSIVAQRVVKWNGSSWNALGGITDNTVYALAFDRSGNLYAGGQFGTIGGVAANCIAKWDGSSWSALGSGVTGFHTEVTALAIDSSGNLYASYESENGASGIVGGIIKWNGSAWNAVGSIFWNGPAHGYVFALACDKSGNLYAGGAFTNPSDTASKNIAKWNGSAWSALGSGTNDWIYALTADSSGNLYAGGYFNTAGGVAANHIAKWNGSAWSALGSGTNNWIYALTADNSGNLYAGGLFDTAGGVAANYIAQWNGSSWDSLGSGTNSRINAITFDASENIYAGGDFTTAGGKTAARVAMCTLNTTAGMPRQSDKVSRPFLTYDAHAGFVHFQLKAQTQITYRIYSLLGRQVFQASETMGVGDHSMRINTGRAARGTYIANFKAGNESLMFRMVVDK
jgi:hypothetical protein